MQLQSLQDVLTHELQDLYDAEKQLLQALPKMAQAASNQELRSAFEHHLTETQDHVQRLDEIFGQFGISGSGETCEAMRGLIKEGEKTIAIEGDPTAKDAALIAAAQRVEHYEIAAYRSAIALAKALGHREAAELLARNLAQEVDMERFLVANAPAALRGAAAMDSDGSAGSGARKRGGTRKRSSRKRSSKRASA